MKKVIAAILLVTLTLTSLYGCKKKQPIDEENNISSSESDTSNEDDDKKILSPYTSKDLNSIKQFMNINLNELKFDKNKVKSIVHPINIDLSGWFSFYYASNDILYIETDMKNETLDRSLSDLYTKQIDAYSISTGKILGSYDGSGYIDIGKNKIAIYEYAQEHGDPIGITICSNDFTIEKKIYIANTLSSENLFYQDGDVVYIISSSISSEVKYIENQNSILYFEYSSKKLSVINVNTLEVSSFDVPQFPDSGMVSIEPTNTDNVVIMSTTYYDEEISNQSTLYIMYDINTGEILDEYTSKSPKQAKIDYFGFNPRYGIFYGYNDIEDISIDGFTTLLVSSNGDSGKISGKGTFSSDSITEIALFDPINNSYKTTLPNEPNAFPEIVLSENRILISYMIDGNLRFGVLEYTDEPFDYPPDKLDFSDDALKSMLGKTVPLVSSDQNWGENLNEPTNYSIISDIAVTFAYAASSVRYFDDQYNIIDNKNIDEIMTQFVLELISVGRYKKDLSEYAVDSPDSNEYLDYLVDYDEIDSILKQVFPESSGAVKFIENEYGRTGPGHSSYSVDRDQYVISPRSWPFSGNYYGAFENNNISINDISFDNSNSILTLDFSFYFDILSDNKSISNAIMDAKIDMDTGEFEIINIKYE